VGQDLGRDAERAGSSLPHCLSRIHIRFLQPLLMLQQEKPDDYVIATGEAHSVREFVQEAFSYAGLDWQKHVEADAKYYRPAEVDILIGDASKARSKLGGNRRRGLKI